MSDKVYVRVQEAVGTFCAKYGLPPAYLRLSSATAFQLSQEVLRGETTPGPGWPHSYLDMQMLRTDPVAADLNTTTHRVFQLERRGDQCLVVSWDVAEPSHNTEVVPAAPQDNRNDVSPEIPKPKDSGVRQHFDTGSQRDTQVGKGRFDLLPVRALRLLAIHFENGAEKYQARNWEKGQPLSRYMNSGIRHAFLHLMGKRDEPHLIAAIWNFMCCVDTEARVNEGLLPKELNDLPESR
jgi:hypothetical protein